MEKIKLKFWCNSGLTEEIVTIEIDTNKDKEQQIYDEFHKWLDNNENCGFEEINN